MNAKADSPDGDQLDSLVNSIQAYGGQHCSMETRNPVDAIKFLMEQRGRSVKDLAPVFGRTNRVYEVLNHRRPLSLATIRKLHTDFGIPAAVLIA